MFSSQRIYITHVKHTHMPFGQTSITSDEMEAIAYSQFNVCHAVMSNPNALVLQESLYENYTPDLVAKNENTKRAKELFPCGIPENYAELTQNQKNYLARRSGAVTLFDLGMLSHLYKSIGKEESQKINALIAAKCFEAIYEPRELLAIKYAKQAARSSSEQNVQVLVIFGEVHDFNLRISTLDENECVFYDGCIETSLSSHDVKVMSSREMIESLYSLSDSKISLRKLSLFHTSSENVDLSNIPSSKDTLPASRISEEDEAVVIQEISNIFGKIKLTKLDSL